MLTPFMRNPSALLVYDSSVLAVFPDSADVLYRRENGQYKAYNVHLDDASRVELHTNGREINIAYGSPRSMSLAGGGKAIVTFGGVLMDDKIREVIHTDYAWRIRRENHWGLLDQNTLRYIQPPDADSISVNAQSHDFRITRNGLHGLYHTGTRCLIPPNYISIGNPATLQNGFVIVQAVKGYTILDKHGRRVCEYLDSIDMNTYSLLNTAAFLHGTEVSLSISDDGRIVVNKGYNAKVKRTGISGGYYPVVVITDGDKLGLYSNEAFKIVLSPVYDAINEDSRSRGFVVWKYKLDKHQGMDSTLLLDADGKIIEAFKGGYNPKEEHGYWFVGGEHRSPLISTTGRTILSAGYELSGLMHNSFFIISKEGHQGIINDTGKWLVPLRLNKIEHDDYDGAGFLTGESYEHGDDKYCLIAPSGELLTKTIYDEIKFSGSRILFNRGRVYGYLDEKGKETVGKWPEEEMDE